MKRIILLLPVALALSSCGGKKANVRQTMDTTNLGGLESVARAHMIAEALEDGEVGAISSAEVIGHGSLSSGVPLLRDIVGEGKQRESFTVKIEGDKGTTTGNVEFVRKGGGSWRVESHEFHKGDALAAGVSTK